MTLSTEPGKRKPIPPPSKRGRTIIRKPLNTIAGLLHEQCRVYRMLVAGKIDPEEFKARMWGTSIIRQTLHTQAEIDAGVALQRLQERLDAIEEVEGRSNGFSAYRRQALPAN
ncbi:hypothetical protein W911_14600 [Hyphomicrobium nitrativorans NL23]|uniref:Uncharacterized protein n=1 Tax=Hyphomicrobium nitrativorans NL23 TaxID=1029756 RepID=V5SIN2_9HYPH|nr:hypothetical protein W911_14600 [Hyphomicrobium nitrativorans NL23]